MDSKDWKGFGDNPVTHSVAHHLMAIAELRDERGYARVSDVARRLGLTRGSVSLTLKALKERGLVEQDDNRFMRLSPKARELVRSIHARQLITQRFLSEVLKVVPEVAEADACKIEHLISGETARQMLAFLRLYVSSKAPCPAFRRAWQRDGGRCDGNEANCAICEGSCLTAALELGEDGEEQWRKSRSS